MTTTTAPHTATEKQADFIRTLLTRIHGTDKAPAAIREFDSSTLPTLTTKSASAYIATLLARSHEVQAPKDSPRALDFSGIPTGRYAITARGTTRYYRLDRPTSGRWDGWTFLNLTDAAGDTLESIRGAERGRILALISRDPHSASVAYGKATGVCGICFRTLSNPNSLARGIGPICAKKF